MKEFQEIYVTLFPKGDCLKFAAHAFRALDTDHDGELDYHEFDHAQEVRFILEHSIGRARGPGFNSRQVQNFARCAPQILEL